MVIDMIPLIVLSLMEFARGAIIYSIIPLYGQFNLGYNLGIIGAAISGHYLFDAIFRIPAGRLNDRYGGKWLLAGGTFLFGLGLYLIYAGGGTTWFIVGASLSGLGMSPLWPSVLSGVTAKRPVHSMGKSLSKVFMAGLIGMGLGMVAINFVIDRSSLAAFLTVAGAIALALVLVLIGIFPRSTAQSSIRLTQYLKELGGDLRAIWRLYPGMFVQTMAIGTLTPILAIYLRKVFGLSAQQYSYVLMGVGAVTVLFLIPAGKIVDRFGLKWPLISGFFLATISLALLPLQRSGTTALLFGALLGFAYSLILPAWNALQARAASPEKRGAMWAVFMTVEGAGTATGAFIGGKVWERFGYSAPFYISALVLGIMTIFYAFGPLDKLMRTNSGAKQV